MFILKLLIILPVFGSSPSIFERAQMAYQKNDFDSFFGMTVWAHLNQWSALSPDLKDQWLALEIMALAKHCRYQEISQFQSVGPLSLKALQIVQLKKEYKEFVENQHNTKKPFVEDVIQKSQLWRLSPKDYAKIKSPENLKVLVKSQCS